jgi:hypothetical protein
MKWNAPIPFYVTRKTACGDTGSLSVGSWALVPIALLVPLNIIGWSVYGLVELVSKVV